MSTARLAAAALAALAAGCTGLIDGGSTGGDDTLTPAQQTAEMKWLSEALPALQMSCTGCHAGSLPAAPAFLAGSAALDIRDTLLDFTPAEVSLASPPSSHILTKGAHEGAQALSSDQASALLDWLAAERTASMPNAPVTTTEPMLVNLCGGGTPDCMGNNFDLGPAGAPGASISFYAQALDGAGLYLTGVTLSAPQGAYVVHPLFVSNPTAAPPNIDPNDSFQSVSDDLRVNSMPVSLGAEVDLGSGFAATDPVSITFTSAGPYDPSKDTNTTVGGGCLALAAFKATAQAPLAASCGNCHTTGAGSNSMLLAGIMSTDDTMIQTACNQAFGEISLAMPATSALLVEPDPTKTDPSHGFFFSAANYPAFQTAITTWIQAEQTAAATAPH